VTTTTTEKTYQMLWDCEYCSHPKLLGVSHRHCPNCGAAQNPAKRYFPPDSEKVAVEDHEYAGADVHCPACREPQSSKANNCGNCGSPLKGGQAAVMHADPTPPPKKKSYAWVFILIGVVLAAIVGIFVMRACWKKEAVLAVTGHSWKRTIDVERYDKVKEDGACSSVPSGARIIDRHKGEKKCTTKKVDQGDGTFKEKTECTEPAEQCTYEVLKWKVARTLEEKGAGTGGTPKWPEVRLGRTGSCEGCEREGKRVESYIVDMKETPGGETHSCTFDSPDKWKKYADGSEWKGKIRVVGGDLDCDSLVAK
jgi:hypothetical protein